MNVIKIKIERIVFMILITFNVPPVAFAGNLANDGVILVLFEE
jgi:hypothetical protein